MNAFKLQKQDNAFLFAGVGAGDDRGDRFGLTRVERQVRNISRDVEEIPGLYDRMVLEALAVPHVRDAAQCVDRSLVPRTLWAKARPPGGMMTTCIWIAFEPTDSAETPTAYRKPCLPMNDWPARSCLHPEIVSSTAEFLPDIEQERGLTGTSR
jgi:hypothetical protein